MQHSASVASCVQGFISEGLHACGVSCVRGFMRAGCHACGVRGVMRAGCHACGVSCVRGVIHAGRQCVRCIMGVECRVCMLLWEHGVMRVKTRPTQACKNPPYAGPGRASGRITFTAACGCCCCICPFVAGTAGYAAKDVWWFPSAASARPAGTLTYASASGTGSAAASGALPGACCPCPWPGPAGAAPPADTCSSSAISAVACKQRGGLRCCGHRWAARCSSCVCRCSTCVVAVRAGC